MIVKQTPFFSRQKKKLKKQQISELDRAVHAIAKDPQIGEQKKGDLSSICVYKFKIQRQLYLLAYSCNNDTLILHSIGTHENFYRDLKRHLQYA